MSHVNFDVEAGPRASLSSEHRRTPSLHSEPDLPKVSTSPRSPTLRRRQTRANTVKSFSTVHNPGRPNWHPGQEPGLDASKPNGGRPSTPTVHEECQITVVDFSEGRIVEQDFNNSELIEFLQKPQESWVKCRWVNVNGLSWDVIQALGRYKGLHRLALEDLIHTNNRTKADWYESHTYIVLTLQKLVHLHHDGEDSGSEEDEVDSIGGTRTTRRGGMMRLWRRLSSRSKVKKKLDQQTGKLKLAGGVHDPYSGFVNAHSEGLNDSPTQKLRTLQRYHGGPNEERLAYMEAHSPLSSRRLAVSAEQVSIFVTADNTVISFFESSADEIEIPILNRLNTEDTLLRKSCDATMIAQAVIDAVIDLALPVTTAYQSVIGDLELEVLTEPSIQQCNSLYIVTSEITMMRSLISPIVNLINALRDHKGAATATGTNARGDIKGVRISPMAQTYLGDVEDHIVLMTESLDQMRRSCDDMIDLIFNTISAYQNESMKQLTMVTIIFLPLTFLSGYFGMNFTEFRAINNSENYFWIIAIPLAFAFTLLMMRDVLKWWFVKFVQRRGISRSRKGRLSRQAQRKEASRSRED